MSTRDWGFTLKEVQEAPDKLRMFLQDLESWQRSWHNANREIANASSTNILGMLLDQVVVPLLHGTTTISGQQDYAAVDAATGRVVLVGTVEQVRALEGDLVITYLPTGALVDVGMLP